MTSMWVVQWLALQSYSAGALSSNPIKGNILVEIKGLKIYSMCINATDFTQNILRLFHVPPDLLAYAQHKS